MKPDPKKYYEVNGKQTYEIIDLVYGRRKLLAFLEINSFKYRMRLMKKDPDPTDDLKKIAEYEALFEKWKEDCDFHDKVENILSDYKSNAITKQEAIKKIEDL